MHAWCTHNLAVAELSPLHAWEEQMMPEAGFWHVRSQAAWRTHILGVHVRSEFVELDDLALFLPEEQAADALEDFDCDADGHISAEDLREAVLQIYENRRARSQYVAHVEAYRGKNA